GSGRLRDPGAAATALAVELGWAPPGVASEPRPRGSAFGLSPGRGPRFRGAGIISARTPVPYPRMKTGSRALDARLMGSKFCIRPLLGCLPPGVVAHIDSVGEIGSRLHFFAAAATSSLAS